MFVGSSDVTCFCLLLHQQQTCTRPSDTRETLLIFVDENQQSLEAKNTPPAVEATTDVMLSVAFPAAIVILIHSEY